MDHDGIANPNGLVDPNAAAGISVAAGISAGPSIATVLPGTDPGTPGEAAEIDRRMADLRTLLEQGLAEGIGVGHSLGIHLGSLEVGRSVWTLQPSPAAANAMFTVHGGVLATLMDTAMGSAVFTSLPPDTYYTTLELKVNFVRSVSLSGDLLSCEAKTVHVGRRTATAEATVTAANGKLVAHGTCTCLLTPA